MLHTIAVLLTFTWKRLITKFRKAVLVKHSFSDFQPSWTGITMINFSFHMLSVLKPRLWQFRFIPLLVIARLSLSKLGDQSWKRS